MAGIGLAAGILLGLAVAFLRLAAATGAAGAVLANAIAFAIPSRYVSTAVLRVKPSGQSGDRLQQLMMEVLSRQTLTDEVRRNVRIQSLNVGPGRPGRRRRRRNGGGVCG